MIATKWGSFLWASLFLGSIQGSDEQMEQAGTRSSSSATYNPNLSVYEFLQGKPRSKYSRKHYHARPASEIEQAGTGASSSAPHSSNLSADDRTKIACSLRNLFDEIGDSPEKRTEKCALFEKERASDEEHLPYIEEMIEMLKGSLEYAPGSKKEEHLGAIRYLEKLKATILVPMGIKEFILHAQESLDAESGLLVVDVPGYLLEPTAPFSDEIRAQLVLETLNLTDLREAIQAELDALFNTARFPGGPLLQALYSLRSALHKDASPQIFSAFDAMGGVLHRAKTIEHDLAVMQRKWDKICPGHKGSTGDEELAGRIKALEHQTWAVLESAELLFSVVPNIQCGMADGSLDLLSEDEGEWAAHIVRHLMGAGGVSPRELTGCVTASIGLSEPNIEGLYSQEGGNLVMAWAPFLGGILDKMEAEHSIIRRMFRSGFDPCMEELLSFARTAMAMANFGEVGKQRMSKMDEIVEEISARANGVLVGLERLGRVMESGAGGWKSARAQLTRIQYYLARSVMDLIRTKDVTHVIVVSDVPRDPWERVERYVIASCTSNGELIWPDLSEEKTGLHLVSLYACEPNVPGSEPEIGLTEDATALGHKIGISMQMILMAVRRECMPTLEFLSKWRKQLPGSPVLDPDIRAFFRSLLEDEEKMAGMPPEIKGLLHWRLFLLQVLSGKADLYHYLDRLLRNAQSLARVLSSTTRMTEQEFTATMEEIRLAENEFAGMTYALDKMIELSQKRGGAKEHMKSEEELLSNIDANVLRALEREVQAEQKKTGAGKLFWLEAPAETLIEKWAEQAGARLSMPAPEPQ